MEAWWNGPRSQMGVTKVTWKKSNEYLTRLAFSWKALKLTGHSTY